jgi:sugar lactone lactonase YvrE
MKGYRLRKIGKVVLYGLAALFIVGVLFIFVYPAPIDPLSWEPPPRPEATGVFAENRLLSDAELLADGQLYHPEDVVFDAEGNLYTGTGDGKIYRITFDENGEVDDVETFAEIDGRPLGLRFDHQGNLIVAVPHLGLVSIDTQGMVHLLTDEVDNTPITFADHLDIASNGTIYFSDASTAHYPGWPYDALEGKPHGRLLRYDPVTEETNVLLDGLYFANGVVLSPDEDYILITESFRYRITRYWLHGDRENTTDVFADNLPILPDNISVDHEGDYWTTGNPRSGLLDRLHGSSFAKRQLAKLPIDFLRELPNRGDDRSGYIVRMSPEGEVKRTYQDPDGRRVYNLSAVVRRGDELYIGTLYGQAIGRYHLND